jgi:hypothetical protein
MLLKDRMSTTPGGVTVLCFCNWLPVFWRSLLSLNIDWLIYWLICIGFEPLWSVAPRPYRPALCAPKSDISSGKPCTFTKVPDGPQTSNLNVLWVQERNPDILSFSLKKSWQANPPPVSPTGPLWREMPAYIDMFLLKKKRNYYHI